MCLRHLRRVSADDATTFGWVNSISAFLHILMSAMTQALRHAHGEHEVHSVAYVTHVVFIWVSTNEDLLARATQQLLDRSRLPRSRFIDDGCGRNHIRA